MVSVVTPLDTEQDYSALYNCIRETVSSNPDLLSAIFTKVFVAVYRELEWKFSKIALII